VCIGPNILRHTDNVSLEASLEASHSVYAVCTILIEKAYTLFPVSTALPSLSLCVRL